MANSAAPANPDYFQQLEWEKLLDAFEREWQSGSRPSWRQFLPPEREKWPMVAQELAKIDREYRLRAGEKVLETDYDLPVDSLAPTFAGAEVTRSSDAIVQSSGPISATGNRLGVYELLEKLGEGGMGAVIKPGIASCIRW
jgi:hypothetical protein